MSKNLPRSEDYSKWYNELVKADLAENSGVRGCMVIKPMAMLFGKKCKQSSIECLKKLGIKMLISIICSSMFEAEEKNAEDLRKNALS
jgi:prolyl-tRNA synthetase